MCGLLLDIPALDSTTRWLLVIAVGMTIFYAVMRPLRKKKDPLERTPVRSSLASQRGVERDMSNLLVELSEMARQLTAQLDTRTMKLEILLKEADDKIAALRGFAVQSPPASVATDGTAPAPEIRTVPPPRLAPKIDPRHLEIYELADQSLSSQQIAGRLGRPRGEIELILKLRERDEAASPS